MDKLSMRKISELLRQRFELNKSYRDIARSLNISISTISDHLAKARIAGSTWPLPSNMSKQELHNKIFLPTEINTRNRILPNWIAIYKELRKKGVTLRLLWREYRLPHQKIICLKHIKCRRNYQLQT